MIVVSIALLYCISVLNCDRIWNHRNPCNLYAYIYISIVRILSILCYKKHLSAINTYYFAKPAVNIYFVPAFKNSQCSPSGIRHSHCTPTPCHLLRFKPDNFTLLNI